MSSAHKLYRGETWHCRYAPAKHSFTYPYYFLSLDLDSLNDLRSLLFGYNRKAVVSISDSDYLNGTGSLRQRFLQLLSSNQVEPLPAKIKLLTVPRIFGYIFNPVNFYLCYDRAGKLQLIVSEVNNTFGESHIYVCDKPEAQGSWIGFHFPKRFYVSPFFPVEGDYHLLFRENGDELEVQVHIISGDQTVFSSAIKGRGSAGSNRSLAFSILSSAFSAWLTMTRIHWQAFQLALVRKIKFKRRPALAEDSFVRKAPSFWSQIRGSVVSRFSEQQKEAAGIIQKEVNNG